MFAHLVLLFGLVYKPLTQLFWSQPKPPLMAHSAACTSSRQQIHSGQVYNSRLPPDTTHAYGFDILGTLFGYCSISNTLPLS